MQPVGRCPRCGYTLRWDGQRYRCGFCGYLHSRRTLTGTLYDIERSLRFKFENLLDTLAKPHPPPGVGLQPTPPIRFQRPCPICGTAIMPGITECPTCGTPQATSPVLPTASPVQTRDQRVLEYIISHEGSISLSKAADDLSVSVDALKLSIERLKSSGFLTQT